MTFHQRLARLQAIVTALESGNTPLAESVALYKEGLAHAAACRKQLEQALHDIKISAEDTFVPFDMTEEDE